MESIPKNDLLQFNSDTLQFLRKQYNLDNPTRIKEAVDILEEWLKKQEHFVMKEMSRDYLEKAIILAKGSIEKVKKKLDTLCTYRTLSPKYFEPFDANDCRNSDTLVDVLLPKMSPDHYRVYILKVIGNKLGPDFTNYYRCFTSICEYIHTYDYCNGIVVIIDYTETNVLDVAKSLDVIEMQQIIKILVLQLANEKMEEKEGYGLRLKGLHLISQSNLVNVMVSFFKQATSVKLSQRIFAHKSFDSLYKLLPQNILPIDYGGNEKNLKDLHDDLVDALISEEFTNHLAVMRGACTNEDLRRKDHFNDEFMGMPGTFRSLCLD